MLSGFGCPRRGIELPKLKSPWFSEWCRVWVHTRYRVEPGRYSHRGWGGLRGDPAHQPFDEGAELPRHAGAHLEHFGVVERRAETGGGVGDNGEPDAAHAARPRADHFGHGGHADGVDAEALQHTDLGRRFG